MPGCQARRQGQRRRGAAPPGPSTVGDAVTGAVGAAADTRASRRACRSRSRRMWRGMWWRPRRAPSSCRPRAAGAFCAGAPLGAFPRFTSAPKRSPRPPARTYGHQRGTWWMPNRRSTGLVAEPTSAFKIKMAINANRAVDQTARFPRTDPPPSLDAACPGAPNRGRDPYPPSGLPCSHTRSNWGRSGARRKTRKLAGWTQGCTRTAVWV